MKMLKFIFPAVFAVAMISCSGETTEATNDEGTKTECSGECGENCDHKKEGCEKEGKSCDHEGECSESCKHHEGEMEHGEMMEEKETE